MVIPRATRQQRPAGARWVEHGDRRSWSRLRRRSRCCARARRRAQTRAAERSTAARCAGACRRRSTARCARAGWCRACSSIRRLQGGQRPARPPCGRCAAARGGACARRRVPRVRRVARYGGDEFVVILPNADLDAAAAAGARGGRASCCDQGRAGARRRRRSVDRRCAVALADGHRRAAARVRRGSAALQARGQGPRDARTLERTAPASGARRELAALRAETLRDC